MRKILMICGIMMISINAIAEVTDTPCANGGGLIVNGVIQGRYCVSNFNMMCNHKR